MKLLKEYYYFSEIASRCDFIVSGFRVYIYETQVLVLAVKHKQLPLRCGHSLLVGRKMK